MQTITTKYIGPTNTKCSRVKATCWLTSITVSWDHALNSENNYKEVIQVLVNKLNSERIGDARWFVVATGSSVDGKGYTAVIDLE